MNRVSMAIYMLAVFSVIYGVCMLVLSAVTFGTLGEKVIFGIALPSFHYTNTVYVHVISMIHFLFALMGTIAGGVMLFLGRKISVHSIMELVLIAISPISIALSIGVIISNVSERVLLDIANIINPIVMIIVAAYPIAINFVFMKTYNLPEKVPRSMMQALLSLGRPFFIVGGILALLDIPHVSNVLFGVGGILAGIELALYSARNPIINAERAALPGKLERIARHVTLRYLFKKSIIITVELFLVASFNFFLVNSQGSPVTMFIRPGVTDPDQIHRIYEALGLNQPLMVRFVKYINAIFHFDFGFSFQWRTEVSVLLEQRIGPTLILMGSSLVISTIIGVILGIWIGLAPYSRRDTFINNLSIILSSFPTFWLGIVLVYIFSLGLGWFPISHMYTPGVVYTESMFWEKVMDILHHMVLPVTTLVLVNIAGVLVLMRDSMIRVMREEYIFVARAKGLPERTVIWAYGVRNAMLPVVTVVALNIGFILSGAVITEQIFDWPGLGTLYFDAVMNSDYPVVLGLLFLTSMMVLVMSLVVDILYVKLDPRIKFQ